MSRDNWTGDIPGIKDIVDPDGVTLPRVETLQFGEGLSASFARGKILVKASGAGGGIGGYPLSAIRFVDKTTTTPSDSRNGQIGSPFSTIAAAVADCPEGGLVRVMPGNYSSEGALSISKDIAIATMIPIPRGIAGLGSFFTGNVTVGALTVASGKTLYVHGVNSASAALPDNTTGIVLCESSYINEITGGLSTDGTVNLYDSMIDTAVCSALYADNAQILGSNTAITCSGTIVDMRQSAFIGDPVTLLFSDSAGTFRVDAYTNYWWKETTETLTNGSKVIIGSLSA